MNRRVSILAGLAGLGVAAIGGGLFYRHRRRAGPEPLPRMAQTDFDRAFVPLGPPEEPLNVYHLGHSLVGRDMPAMLAQLEPGHGFHSQLGWGTSLREHWLGPAEVRGYDTDNVAPFFRPAREAIESGDYDAVVLTEMLGLQDAIRWHASSHYLAEWARLARAARPDVRLYLYETWHNLDAEGGWLERIDGDAVTLWQDELTRRAMSAEGVGTIYRIPGGPVLAEVARAAEAGQIAGIDSREALFHRAPDGTLDTIHINDLGSYLIALTHFAVLYQRSPEGLAHRLMRADGTPADAFDDAAALQVQAIVWQVVRGDPLTGMAV